MGLTNVWNAAGCSHLALIPLGQWHRWLYACGFLFAVPGLVAVAGHTGSLSALLSCCWCLQSSLRDMDKLLTAEHLAVARTAGN